MKSKTMPPKKKKTPQLAKYKNEHISKIRNAKGKIKQTPQKSKKSSKTTLRTYILINWKILKKWTNF
jgi:hypothetical protein